MPRRLKGTEGGILVVVWVRKAFSEQECKEEEEGVGGNEEFCSLSVIQGSMGISLWDYQRDLQEWAAGKGWKPHAV